MHKCSSCIYSGKAAYILGSHTPRGYNRSSSARQEQSITICLPSLALLPFAAADGNGITVINSGSADSLTCHGVDAADDVTCHREELLGQLKNAGG